VRIEQWLGDRSLHSAGTAQEKEVAPEDLPEVDDESSDERIARETETRARITTALQTLPNREAHIISARYLRDTKATLGELASELGISAERVRQLEQNALKKLGAALVESPRTPPQDEDRALRRAKYARDCRIAEFRDARRKGRAGR